MEKFGVYFRKELRKVLVKQVMKVEEKKNLVKICYDAMLLLKIHLLHGRGMGIYNTLHIEMLEVKEQTGVPVTEILIQIQTIVMKFNQCGMTLRKL
jgi:hypothetical protein